MVLGSSDIPSGHHPRYDRDAILFPRKHRTLTACFLGVYGRNMLAGFYSLFSLLILSFGHRIFTPYAIWSGLSRDVLFIKSNALKEYCALYAVYRHVLHDLATDSLALFLA